MSNITTLLIEEAQPDLEGNQQFEVDLQPGITASDVRWVGRRDPKLWSITLKNVARDSVVIRERERGSIELASTFIIDAKKLIFRDLKKERRIRAGTNSRVEALKLAERCLLERYSQRYRKGELVIEEELATGEEPTINQVFARLRGESLLGGDAKQLQTYDRVMDIASLLWDGQTTRPSEINSRHVAYYFGRRCGKRIDDIRREYVFKEGDGPGIAFPKHWRRRSLPASQCTPWSAEADLRGLSSVFNTAVKAGMIARNPLGNLDFSEAQKGSRDPYYPERFFLVERFLDVVDPSGALRFFTVLIHETAARPSTMRASLVDDFPETEMEILRIIRMIRREGLHIHDREKPMDDWAEVWAVEHGGFGAYYQRHLKGKGRQYVRIIPQNRTVKLERERYMAKRLDAGITSSFLFPDPEHPEQPIDDDVLRTRYLEAEALARDYWAELGVNVEKYLDERDSDVFYPYRHRWQDARDIEGWADNPNASYVGGWTTQRWGGSEVQTYRKLKPHFMLAIATGRKVTEVVEHSTEADEARYYATAGSSIDEAELLERMGARISMQAKAA